MIVSELPEEVASTDQAFASAITPKKFKEVSLQPYSLMRQLVAIEICGDTPHAVTSVIVHTWVCTRSPAEVLEARTDRKRALQEAFEWAEANGVRHAGTPEMDELISIYGQINKELLGSTQLMQETNNGHEPKNAGGLPG